MDRYAVLTPPFFFSLFTSTIDVLFNLPWLGEVFSWILVGKE